MESVFKDKDTPTPFVELFPEDDGESARAALPNHIYMDAMGFGMGNCCLQVRWQWGVGVGKLTRSLFSPPARLDCPRFVWLQFYGVPGDL